MPAPLDTPAASYSTGVGPHRDGGTNPGLIALGAFIAIVPLLRSDRAPMARSFLAIVSLVFLLRYLFFGVSRRRCRRTPDGGCDHRLSLHAAGSSLACRGRAVTAVPEPDDRPHQSGKEYDGRATDPHAPLIDVFICTYNEERRSSSATIVGAMAMDYPTSASGCSTTAAAPGWQLCSELGCGYITRPTTHAKAGNINHALAYLRCRSRPSSSRSSMRISCRCRIPVATMALLREADVGVVQTPQHFVNPDPIQINLGADEVWPDEQRFFFDVVMPSKDAWGAAFCCGTSSLIRFEAFDGDRRVSDRLGHRRLSGDAAAEGDGFRTVYLNERLTSGSRRKG